MPDGLTQLGPGQYYDETIDAIFTKLGAGRWGAEVDGQLVATGKSLKAVQSNTAKMPTLGSALGQRGGPQLSALSGQAPSPGSSPLAKAKQITGKGKFLLRGAGALGLAFTAYEAGSFLNTLFRDTKAEKQSRALETIAALGNVQGAAQTRRLENFEAEVRGAANAAEMAAGTRQISQAQEERELASLVLDNQRALADIAATPKPPTPMEMMARAGLGRNLFQ